MNPDTDNPTAFTMSDLTQAASEAHTNGNHPDNQGQATDTEELSYAFVPPKKTVTVLVHYRIQGRGQPLPYPLDEEDGQ